MATADFEFSMTVNGTAEEISSILKIMKKYTECEKGVYFSFVEIEKGGETGDVDDMDAEELEAFASENDGTLIVSASGPFGHYGELNDVDIFRDMAEAAPGASFEAEITGNTTYTEQSLSAELKDGMLHIKTFFEANEECGDSYIEYFCSKLPYDEFAGLFRIDTESFDSGDYETFINDAITCDEGNFTEMEYDIFMDDIDGVSSLDENEYSEVMKSLATRSIMSYEEFELDYDGGNKEEFDYDPAAKKYIGRDNPVMKSNTVYGMNEFFREYLKNKGLPHDDEALAALSLDDAYAIMAGTYGDSAPEAAEEAAAELIEDNKPEAHEKAIPETVEKPEAKAADISKKRSKTWIIWLIIAAVIIALAAVYIFCKPAAELVNDLIARLMAIIS